MMIDAGFIEKLERFMESFACHWLSFASLPIARTQRRFRHSEAFVVSNPRCTLENSSRPVTPRRAFH
jgi:hypothetical protein